MDYNRIYQNLISIAQQRCFFPGEDVERHHIVPRCLGGSDDISNLVDLTPEEHYFAHLLLVKLNPDHEGLLCAVIKMSGHRHYRKTTNKLYGWIKRRLQQKRKGIPRSEETKKKISESRKGQPPSHTTPHSEETKKKISESRKGKGKNAKSEETKLKMSKSAQGRTYTEERNKKVSESLKGKPWSQARRDAQLKKDRT